MQIISAIPKHSQIVHKLLTLLTTLIKVLLNPLTILLKDNLAGTGAHLHVEIPEVDSLLISEPDHVGDYCGVFGLLLQDVVVPHQEFEGAF